jgi:hypothetical protein
MVVPIKANVRIAPRLRKKYFWKKKKKRMRANLKIKIGKVTYKNQLDVTITIYWSPRSAQHVSGNLLPIFRRCLQHLVQSPLKMDLQIVLIWYVVLINVIMIGGCVVLCLGILLVLYSNVCGKILVHEFVFWVREIGSTM